uniref:Uncharacterized protein n=1 Tax=Glossina palpalis gambiensis TaxID=67801 RepID=A0A1B0BP64_9MUSC
MEMLMLKFVKEKSESGEVSHRDKLGEIKNYEDLPKYSNVDEFYLVIFTGVRWQVSSELRAKFENLAKSTEEDSRKRAEEQKRLREAKDKRDRDEAAKQAVCVLLGNARSAFNQMQSPSKEATDTSRKEPIHIPREPSKVEETENDIEQIKETKVKAAPPPDLIPSIEMQTVVTPPSEVQLPEPPERQITSNNKVPGSTTINTTDVEAVAYPNFDNLADYIEDTNIHAIALYDYQAADDDEISFDLDDITTQI